MILAIDGPSGAGKSTIAKSVATRLGFKCLDTGAMYRSVAWKALDAGIVLDDAAALGELARTCVIAFDAPIAPDGPERVIIDGNDVTEAIRTARIDAAVSPVSAVPAVRMAMLDQQRRIGALGDYVVEGRDIGTAVFPDAQVKVFLTASDETRAQRRVEQNRLRGIGSTDFDEVLASIRNRDRIDSSRDVNPLAAASDATVIDSSDLTLAEVEDAICALVDRARRA